MKKILFFLAFSVACITVNAQVINVPGDFDLIQEAIVAANDGDTVLVAQGTYLEHINFLGKKIMVASHYLLDPGNPFIVANTIIDGSMPARTDSNSVVHFMSGEDTNSVIYGFTIRNGSGTLYKGGGIVVYNSGAKIVHNRIINNKVLPSGYGGGIYAGGLGYQPQHMVIIEDNLIQDDSLFGLQPSGGGMLVNLNARIKNNTIKDNVLISTPAGGIGEALGAGISCSLLDYDTQEFYSIEISGNTIQDNQAMALTAAAGGIYVFGGSAKISDNIISGNLLISETEDANYASGAGLLLGVLQKGSVISGNTIENNQAICPYSTYGGGINLYSTTDSLISNTRIFIEKNIIRNNEAKYGGGIRIYSANVCIRNNFINHNNGQLRGGGLLLAGSIENQDSVVMIINNTFSENHTTNGVAWLNYLDKIIMMNNIFYNDSATYEIRNMSGPDSLLQIHHNLIDPAEILGVWQGENNINADPELIEGTYYLDASSPCLGSGALKVNVYGKEFNCTEDDIEGTPRPQSTSPEIGAFEMMFTEVQENKNAGLEMSIFPNPFSRTARLTFMAEEAGIVKMVIYDIAGSLIEEKVLNCQAAGRNETIIDASDLSPGVYFVRIINGKTTGTGKLVVY